MRTLNRSKDFVSTLPTAINQKLVDDGYRVRLFAKIKDSLEKKKQSLKKEELELKEWIEKKSFINILKPVNNYWFSRYIRA
ncbi:hypothetical protein AAHK07_02545 [Aliarcobacter cryaerophilus]|uniref:hypothetical protein n=1 Tax=Aliarcobacter cryaerophilus TaxID=28198 RepID=UPI000835E15E|nr:hypothetical protein [Aliarcobacter cryaerophilus]